MISWIWTLSYSCSKLCTKSQTVLFIPEVFVCCFWVLPFRQRNGHIVIVLELYENIMKESEWLGTLCFWKRRQIRVHSVFLNPKLTGMSCSLWQRGHCVFFLCIYYNDDVVYVYRCYSDATVSFTKKSQINSLLYRYILKYSLVVTLITFASTRVFYF